MNVLVLRFCTHGGQRVRPEKPSVTNVCATSVVAPHLSQTAPTPTRLPGEAGCAPGPGLNSLVPQPEQWKASSWFSRPQYVHFFMDLVRQGSVCSNHSRCREYRSQCQSSLF